MTSRAWLPAHSTLAQEGQQVGQSMPGWWAEISHQDPSFCICGSWELRFDLATANHFFLRLQDSLKFDTSRDALASSEVTEEAQSLAAEPPFRVLVSEGPPKVTKTAELMKWSHIDLYSCPPSLLQ